MQSHGECHLGDGEVGGRTLLCLRANCGMGCRTRLRTSSTYGDNGRHLGRVYNKARLPQTTAQELLRVVDKTQQLIRRPNVLKEHYHETSMHIQKSVDARGVYNVCVTFHDQNFW